MEEEPMRKQVLSIHFCSVAKLEVQRPRFKLKVPELAPATQNKSSRLRA
jgi:hypothetical protein